MTIASGIVIYLISWWLVFFMALPFGVKRSEQVEEGHEPGAPEKPMLWMKAAVTSVIAAVILVIWYYVQQSDLITIQR
ncbi:DUF1467 family protein [Aestuariispira ectoiniformans]|uniref:DUF1467 family protein n=1 Tax=Aestuariispira ectoiniformans TaxID=2775080 RepID=UPI00223AFC0E|nr:DUF1467 family protein [Aestuariispira ectoiniformans]